MGSSLRPQLLDPGRDEKKIRERNSNRCAHAPFEPGAWKLRITQPAEYIFHIILSFNKRFCWRNQQRCDIKTDTKDCY